LFIEKLVSYYRSSNNLQDNLERRIFFTGYEYSLQRFWEFGKGKCVINSLLSELLKGGDSVAVIIKNKEVQEKFRKELLEKIPDEILIRLWEQINKHY
jgi:hypothetical protein